MSNSKNKSTQLKKDQSVEESSDVIIYDTGKQSPTKPNLGLIKTRKEYLVSMLGENSDLVTVVVQSYNRLDKTKNCVESILKYTKNVDYELILIDNGSTDDTLKYYKSVEHPRKKVIHVTKNIGSVVNSMKYISGRYIAFITNDTYVTQNWIENLLTCLKSDDAIGMVVPVVSNGSNLQGADITFNSLDEMYEKAASYNISDPRKWHERIRLAFQMVIYKREALDAVGIMLDYGFYHDFADDDITFRIRRAGYKAILCKDTFVHHDHIRTKFTPSEAQNFNESIKSGQLDFNTKYFGLDAWEDVNNYELTLLSMVDPKQHQSSNQVKILGVDVLCGTPILEIKNKLRENSVFDVKLSAFTSDPKYWIDLKAICSGKVIVDRLEFLSDHFKNPEYDFVFLGKPINTYSDPNSLLLSLIRTVKQGGRLLLKLYNTSNFLKLFRILGVKAQLGNMAVEDINYIDLDIDQLVSKLRSLGFLEQQIKAENWPIDQKSMELIKTTIANAGLAENINLAMSRSMIKEYSLILQKQ